ncbi:Hint domain-containing protein [Rubellimicrobium roseum]|uniref:NHR domain-containing protein n=1 Tax=Rubellimicrobium roseum TaxID=687525 RepID=A0A5C4NL74_9RHOB|nr:Hint domain-containing protein [Rubellimicrobium roseum]TNC73427.1 hypothetical protein FHG71_06185 [Rubellimicrobium roseum]
MRLHDLLSRPVQPLTLMAGLGAGTRLRTPDGEADVSGLRAGDRLVTGNGVTTLRGVEARAARLAPIRILAGTLRHGRPEDDLLVGPATPLRLEGWRARALYGRAPAMVAAHRLVDGIYVVEEPLRGMTLWTLDLDGPAVVWANGVEVGV